MGQEQYCWFVGKVEDRDDPLLVGRVRVRPYNYYSQNKALVPTSALPWAYCIQSINSAALDEVGLSPTGIKVGSTVVGFFADGREAQIPVVLGTLAGVRESLNDLPKRSRGINSLAKQLLEKEPADPFKARYPFNKVFRSESGHIIEIDDTPGAERIHIYHRSGSYVEINNKGDMVSKVVGDGYEIAAQNKNVFIQGTADVHISGTVNLKVDGTVNITAPTTNIKGDVNVTGLVTVTKDVIGGGISLKNHVHGGVQSGGSLTSPPV